MSATKTPSLALYELNISIFSEANIPIVYIMATCRFHERPNGRFLLSDSPSGFRSLNVGLFCLCFFNSGTCNRQQTDIKFDCLYNTPFPFRTHQLPVDLTVRSCLGGH